MTWLPADVEAAAKAAFAAYNEQAGGLTWDGKPIPPWEQTGPRVQANWWAAVVAGVEAMIRADTQRLAASLRGPQLQVARHICNLCGDLSCREDGKCQVPR